MDRLRLSDLRDVFDRLETHEKVSFIFLTFEPRSALEECERLLSERSEQSEGCAPSLSDGALNAWAQSKGELWKPTLVEALLILKAYADVRGLGLDRERYAKLFSTEIREVSKYVHPMKKTLFAVCEELTKAPTAKLIDEASQTCDSYVPDPLHRSYFELFLLKLIQNERIVLGAWKTSDDEPVDGDVKCDVKLLAKLLKPDFYSDLYQWVTAAEQAINSEIDKSSPIRTGRLSDFSVNPTSIVDEYPIIDHNEVGHFLIFNNKVFEGTQLTDRNGTEKDVAVLEECWKRFGFRVTVFNDVPHNKIASTIANFAKNRVETTHSIFAVSILSHGEKGKIYGSDSLPVDIQIIKKSFLSKRLNGKPKILIVQACRGNKVMGALSDSDEEPSNSLNRLQIQRDGTHQEEKIAAAADFLLFWSTVDDYVSFRDVLNGSWFIQELCEKMMQEGENDHLMDVFTAVNNGLGNKSASLKKKNIHQISQLESTFRKKLKLKKVGPPY